MKKYIISTSVEDRKYYVGTNICSITYSYYIDKNNKNICKFDTYIEAKQFIESTLKMVNKKKHNYEYNVESIEYVLTKEMLSYNTEESLDSTVSNIINLCKTLSHDYYDCDFNIRKGLIDDVIERLHSITDLDIKKIDENKINVSWRI